MEIAKLPKPGFKPLANGYSHCNAYACAIAAWLSYQKDSAVLDCCRSFGIELVEPLRREPNSALVLKFAEALVIAFKGTSTKADWRTNLAALPAVTAWGTVHKGFKTATDSFWPELGEQVERARSNQQSIWLTGHSLGGALATLATVRLLHKQGLAISGLYTFGQPPAGYLKFTWRLRNELQDHYFRVVNYRDVVVDMGGLGGFSKHGGQLVYFDRLGKLHFSQTMIGGLTDAAIETGKLLSSVGSLLRGKYEPYLDQATRPVTSHKMEYYLQLLGNKIESGK